jgi:HEAT repeat protein
VRCLHELDARETIPQIRLLARDSNEAVRISAIVALSDWSDEESTPAFEEAAVSPNKRLQRAGLMALQTARSKRQ